MEKPLISVRIRLCLSSFLFMKIKYNNQDLKTSNWCGPKCTLCAFHPVHHLHYCLAFCRSDKIWAEDTCNSDIFIL